MKQKKQWKSRAGRGLSLFELTIANGFCWNRLWDTQERNGTAVLPEEPVHGKIGQSCTMDLRVRDPHSSSLAKCSSIGDIPAPCCKSTALRAASIQKSRETRSLLRLATLGPLQVPFQDVVHLTLTGTHTLQNMKNLDAHREIRSLLQKGRARGQKDSDNGLAQRALHMPQGSGNPGSSTSSLLLSQT